MLKTVNTMENSVENTAGQLPFSSIELSRVADFDTSSANLISGELDANDPDMAQVKLGKTPKRVLHFSDGVIEEYSTDEDDEVDSKTTSNINPKTLTWGPWFWYHTLMAGSTSLRVCDYLGESLAGFFGITTPKYQYEIEEYKRIIAEEEELKKREDLEMGGWRKDPSQAGGKAIQSAPIIIPQKDEPPSFQPPIHQDYGDSESKTNQRY